MRESIILKGEVNKMILKSKAKYLQLSVRPVKIGEFLSEKRSLWSKYVKILQMLPKYFTVILGKFLDL